MCRAGATKSAGGWYELELRQRRQTRAYNHVSRTSRSPARPIHPILPPSLPPCLPASLPPSLPPSLPASLHPSLHPSLPLPAPLCAQADSGSLQSLCWAAYAVGQVGSAWFSGSLVERLGPRCGGGCSYQPKLNQPTGG